MVFLYHGNPFPWKVILEKNYEKLLKFSKESKLKNFHK